MFGDRLRLARKRAGLSLRALADRLGGQPSAQALGKYERGEMKPTSRVLIALSKTLDVPIGYFMSPVGAALDGVDFRKSSTTSARDRARVEAEVLQDVERYLIVEEILDLNSAVWDKPDLDGHITDLAQAEQLADELREVWDLGEDPIPDMTELLEEHGIKVLLLSLPGDVSGLTCLVRRSGERPAVPVIVVNENHNLERRRFTLAHELAHRVIDPNAPFDMEKAANRFAGAFLVSADHLRGQAGPERHAVSYRELVDLKHLYRISAAALVVRLQQTGIITQPTLSYVFRTVGRTWRREEPEELEINAPAETPQRFERLCYRALSEELISLSKAVELLSKPAEQIEADVRGPGYHAGHH